MSIKQMWSCRNEGYDLDEAADIYAEYPEDAAEQYAEQSDNEQCDWPRSRRVIVVVEDKEVTYVVNAESVRKYTATPVAEGGAA